MIRRSFEDGSALRKFHAMIIAQGVSKSIADQLVSNDETVVNAILKLSDAQHQAVVSQTGFVQAIDSYKLGTIVQRLGRVNLSFVCPIRVDLCFRRWSFEIDG